MRIFVGEVLCRAAWVGKPVVHGYFFLALFGLGCHRRADLSPAAAESPVTKLGSIEVTARLVEVPEGAIFKRDLYDYATILKFEVLTTQRGETHAATIFVGEYNPFKPRRQAADRRVKEVGGNAKSLAPGRASSSFRRARTRPPRPDGSSWPTSITGGTWRESSPVRLNACWSWSNSPSQSSSVAYNRRSA